MLRRLAGRGRLRAVLAVAAVPVVLVAVSPSAQALSTAPVKPGWYTRQPIAFTQCHKAEGLGIGYAQVCYTRTSRFGTQITVVINDIDNSNDYGYNWSANTSQKVKTPDGSSGWMRSSCGVKHLTPGHVLYCVGTNIKWPEIPPVDVTMDGSATGTQSQHFPVSFYQYMKTTLR